MEVVSESQELRLKRDMLKEPVGLVPTMGFLHEGHLSLVRRARLDCASLVVSIFVNPTQFGPQEDLAKYPRNLQRDLDLLAQEGVDLVWTPSEDAVYPPGYQTWVTVEEISKPLEGAMRPGHFRGVATVVAKLFNSVQPQKAYFGQKDAQQAAVIRRMVQDLDFPIEIIICPTVRGPDGLAMSSRNVYLSLEERRKATALSRSLFEARAAFNAGEREAKELLKIVLDLLASEKGVKVQYVSCADPETLQELDGRVSQALISMAVTIGKTRLIDNIILSE
jgi:pantoate--beta-alanine ligase